MSKFLAALLSLTIVISAGCATAPPKAPSQKEVHKAAIDNTSKVEIFYHPAEYAVMDMGGSGATGMAGLFGPIGMLIAVGVDASSKLTMAERTEARSKDFAQSVRVDKIEDVNLSQAEQLAVLIQTTGREVKLTKITRPKGGKTLGASTNQDLKFTEGYAPLLLRVTTGYGAESATSSYKSIAVTEFALLDAKGDGQTLVSNSTATRDNGVTYQTFDELKNARAVAVASLRQDLGKATQFVFEQTFAAATAAEVAKK